MTDLHDQAGTAVVVVGGGILGAVTASELACAGVPCILLESMHFGHESTGNRQVIACETVVLAAEGWSPALARTAGVDPPIRLMREQDVVFDTGAEAPPPMSVSALVDRTYMRPLVGEGSSLLLVGRGFPKPYDYVTTDDCNWDLDQVFVDDVRTRLTGRFPALRELRLRDGRVGLYSVRPDWHPLLGPVDEAEGLHLATGGSGHCFKLGPAIGAMVAGAILGTPVDYADIRDLRLGRFAAGETFQSTYGGNRA